MSKSVVNVTVLCYWSSLSGHDVLILFILIFVTSDSKQQYLHVYNHNLRISYISNLITYYFWSARLILLIHVTQCDVFSPPFLTKKSSMPPVKWTTISLLAIIQIQSVISFAKKNVTVESRFFYNCLTWGGSHLKASRSVEKRREAFYDLM